MNLPFQVRYLHRDGLNVTEFVVDGIGGGTFEGTEEQAQRYAVQCNRTIEARGLPGKCFAVLARSLTQAEVEALMP